MKTTLRIATALLFALSLRAADVPISGLPAASTLTGAEIVPGVQSGTTVKITVSNLSQGLANATDGTAGLMSAADKTTFDAATNSATASTIVKRDGSGDAAFHAVSLTAGTISGTPSGSTDIANKAYVDAAASGLTVKTAARVATTGAITLSGTQTIDGVAVVATDRVLVKNQADATTNGIYVCAAGAWSRSTDADTGAKLVTNSYIFVTAGTVNFSTGWIMATPNPITIGSSNIVWALYSALGSIPASSITGQLITSQIANLAITTAQFAANLTPVEIVGTLPVSGNFSGRTVFLTSDNKLYRYNGSSFIASVATVDLSGTINGTSQITSGSITAASIAANTITASKIAAGTITANEIAANTITAAKIAANTLTAGTIAAGAIGTTELAVGGITGVKIANGTITSTQIAANTITADRLNVSSLSAISANIGTITNGSLTSSASISVGSGKTAVTISGSTFTIGDIGITSYSGIGTQLTANTGNHQVYLYSSSSAACLGVVNNTTGAQILLFDTGEIRVNSGLVTVNTGSTLQGPGTINLFGGNANALNISCGEDGASGAQQGYLVLQINGRAMKVPFYNL